MARPFTHKLLSISGASLLACGVALVALFSVPIFSTVLPPLVDYPNHLARFALLLGDDNPFYAVRWAPLPNLAGDLLVPALARLMPLEWAGRLFLVSIFALTVGGAMWLNRVATGAWRPWPLIAAAFLYNRQFLWGFINYLFGLGVMLCGVALWLAVERARPGFRIAASSLVALLCFFSHIAAFGLYALAILGVEAQPGLSELRAREWTAMWRRAALAGAQFAAPAAIVLVTWQGAAGAIGYGGFWRKADLLFSVFDNYSRPFDIACFALLVVLLGWLAWRRRLRLAPRLVPPLALVFAAYLLLPTELATGFGADHRLPIALFLLLIAAAAPSFPSRRAALITGSAIAVVMAARLGIVEAVWLQADQTYRADLGGLDRLPAGTRLAVAYPPEAVNFAAIPEIHLPTLAVARRAGFVPTLFAFPAQQPIALKQPYAALAAAAPPDALWTAFIAGGATAGALLQHAIASFDAIVFIDRRPLEVPTHPCLEPLFARPTFRLFALRRGQGCP